MLVLGDVASDAAEKVFEKRELELEDRWKIPMSTVYVQLFQYTQGNKVVMFSVNYVASPIMKRTTR